MDVPAETVRRGEAATWTYIVEFEKSSQVIHRWKVCVVGPSQWGKTSLIKSLITRSSSLEHPDNRTIAIDQFRLNRTNVVAPNKVHLHEVTFWDFAGQDAYQVVHSLFFSPRTLFVVCVDLNSYALVLMQTQLRADNEIQDERIRGQQNCQVDSDGHRLPTGRRVCVCWNQSRCFATEAQVVRKDQDNLFKRLGALVGDMNKEINQAYENLSKSKRVADDKRTDTRLTAQRLKTLQATVERLSSPTLLRVSCVNNTAVADARTLVLAVLLESKRCFQMPDAYSKTLEAVREKRRQLLQLEPASRMEQTFAHVDNLCEYVQGKVQGMTKDTCRAILQTLHDLGDVLWYETLGIARLQNTVILDPMQLIDFIRPIVDHDHRVEMLPHTIIKGLPLWVDIDKSFTLVMKQLLQAFHLVHPSRGEMAWDSDLIVPAFWRTKLSATVLFGWQQLSLENEKPETTRIRWEYHFVSSLPESIFDQLVVASYSTMAQRRAGPDWILYEKANCFACRIMVKRDTPTQERVLCLEAVACEDRPELWSHFKRLCIALETVLDRSNGVIVTRHAYRNDVESCRLGDVIGEWQQTQPTDRVESPWVPPDLSWCRIVR